MRKLILFILIALGIIVVISRVSWQVKLPKPLDGVIVDKTVLTHPGQEHTSFYWFLVNDKYTRTDTALYDTQNDYQGFFPVKTGEEYDIKGLERYSHARLDSMEAASQFLYFADLYGMYTREWNKRENVTEHSRKIYGGMSEEDLYLALRHRDHNKLVLSEFVSVASPTPKGIRKKFEKNFDFEWTEWIGQYHHSLDTAANREIPRWFIRNYLEQHNNKWPFHRSGIILIREGGKVEVMEKDTHLNDPMPYITTPENYANYYGIWKKFDWPYWFDIIIPKGKTEVVSEHNIDTNTRGDSLLAANGLTNTFPAVVRNFDYPNRFYYFAGDFADNPVSLWNAKFNKVEKAYWLFAGTSDKENRNMFFWKFYQPLVRRIFSDYYTALKSTEQTNNSLLTIDTHQKDVITKK